MLQFSVPPGYQQSLRMKNGPALAGHGAEAVRIAILRSMSKLPEELRLSLTWDQGAKMAQHVKLRIDTGLDIFFAIRKVLGSAAQTKTLMACYGSAFQRAPILDVTRQKN